MLSVLITVIASVFLPRSACAPCSSALLWVTVSTVVNKESSLGSGWQWLLELFPLLGSRWYDLLSRIYLEFQIVNLLLLPMTFPTPCFFSLVPHCGQVSEGTAVDSGFLGRASSSSTAAVRLVRVRSTCSGDCFTYGSISGRAACDQGLGTDFHDRGGLFQSCSSDCELVTETLGHGCPGSMHSW